MDGNNIGKWNTFAMMQSYDAKTLRFF
jgi:hypothetical protein